MFGSQKGSYSHPRGGANVAWRSQSPEQILHFQRYPFVWHSKEQGAKRARCKKPRVSSCSLLPILSICFPNHIHTVPILLSWQRHLLAVLAGRKHWAFPPIVDIQRRQSKVGVLKTPKKQQVPDSASQDHLWLQGSYSHGIHSKQNPCVNIYSSPPAKLTPAPNGIVPPTWFCVSSVQESPTTSL